MDIQQQFNELVEGGMPAEEALQKLKAEYEKLLAEGQIDEETYQGLLEQLQGLMTNAPQGEPKAEMPEAAPMQEQTAAPVEDTDPFADRAQQLLDSGEFEDFDEAYDFAMDEQSGGQDEQAMMTEMVTKFLANEIDEAQVLEMLKKLKMVKGDTMTQTVEAPQEKY
jgi:hypothetical protein